MGGEIGRNWEEWNQDLVCEGGEAIFNKRGKEKGKRALKTVEIA